MGKDPSRSRAPWLALGVALMVLVAGWAAVLISDMMQSGHPLRAAVLAVSTALLLVMGLVVAAAQWRGSGRPRKRPVIQPEAGDPTGIWGVGGPSMREPGDTGNWPTRGVDRRYENPQD
jgi:energy-converting hydrogenase Eha subunit F